MTTAIVIVVAVIAIVAAVLAARKLGQREGRDAERARCVRRAQVAGRWEAGQEGATPDSTWRAVVDEVRGTEDA